MRESFSFAVMLLSSMFAGAFIRWESDIPYYHWDDSGIEALEEKYNVTFKVEDMTCTVSGLTP